MNSGDTLYAIYDALTEYLRVFSLGTALQGVPVYVEEGPQDANGLDPSKLQVYFPFITLHQTMGKPTDAKVLGQHAPAEQVQVLVSIYVWKTELKKGFLMRGSLWSILDYKTIPTVCPGFKGGCNLVRRSYGNIRDGNWWDLTTEFEASLDTI